MTSRHYGAVPERLAGARKQSDGTNEAVDGTPGRNSGSFWVQEVLFNCKTAPVVQELSEETNSSTEMSSRPQSNR